MNLILMMQGYPPAIIHKRDRLEAGVAPPLALEATHKDMLRYAEIEVLKNMRYKIEPILNSKQPR